MLAASATAGGVSPVPVSTSSSLAMPASPTASTRIEDNGVVLEVELSMPASDTVQLRYRLRNGGTQPLAVFDRGDRHAVLSGRQPRGAMGAPVLEETGGGDVVLRHVARTAPAGPTGPTSPATPLALRLAPGAVLEDGFVYPIPVSPPRRLRWCLGVAGFSPGSFFGPEPGGKGEVWQVSDPGAQRQLCTPWFDCARGMFVES